MAQVLGQTQAFSPAPKSRLIVPEGHVNWMGVDPGTKRIAIATVSASGKRGVSMVSLPDSAGGTRLAAIFHETRRLVAELAGLLPPGVVVVEQPSGSQPNPSLSYAVGVVMAAVFEGVRGATGFRVRVETVPSSSWKKTAIGRGDAWKPKGRDARIEDYAVYCWATAEGYRGSSYDEVDALGIAVYAQRTFGLEVR